MNLCSNLFKKTKPLFQYKSNLCFKNWIQDGILYIKDIFDKSCESVHAKYFMNKLKNLCVYIMLSKAILFRVYLQNHDCNNSINPDVHFLLKTMLWSQLKTRKVNFIIRWKNLFNISSYDTYKNEENIWEKSECIWKKIGSF